jgi:hypothetical protein
MRRGLIVTISAVGLAFIWLGTQTVGQEHGPDPRGKIFVASWIETELWVNPWLLALGVLMVATAVTLFAIHRRPAT